eukprot:CAMPEP_0117443980 /NCGR_PEP_ID=MMETSP0759-20121206/4991_1 /TAXON_ID=63605 /ORGANISM="Percolomonas cosmopolitus, Strain WS" /LENGTH=298 /DNA_ID=CAMNT_0005236005 /DNA_START=125 /DNA_END=1018 /DNA_ORIENTATION=+
MSSPLYHDDTIVLKSYTSHNVIKVDYNNHVACTDRNIDPCAEFTILKVFHNGGRDAIRSGDKVQLRNVRTGNFLEVEGSSVKCQSRNKGHPQTFEVYRQSSQQLFSDSDLWLKAHTGKYVHVDSNGNMGANWMHTHRGGFQHLSIMRAPQVQHNPAMPTHVPSTSSSSNAAILRNSGISVSSPPPVSSNATVLQNSGIRVNQENTSGGNYGSNAQLVGSSSSVSPQQFNTASSVSNNYRGQSRNSSASSVSSSSSHNNFTPPTPQHNTSTPPQQQYNPPPQQHHQFTPGPPPPQYNNS